MGCNNTMDKSTEAFNQTFDERFKDELKQLEEMEKSGELDKIEPQGNELQCPCCDYFTLGERGEYQICPICFWEDDGVDITNLDEQSWSNHITLREGRSNFKKFGACNKAMIKNVLTEADRKKFKFEQREIK